MAMCMRLLLLPFFLIPGGVYAQAVISGRVLGYDGEPLPHAAVVLVSNASSFPREQLAQFEVASDGGFEFALPAPAIHRLWFTGLYHERVEWPVYVEESDTVEVEVHLGAYGFAADTLVIHYALDEARRDLRWERLQVTERDTEAAFVVRVPAGGDTLAYNIEGLKVENGRRGSSGGLVADRYEINREGEHDALLNVQGESGITFRIDPTVLPLNPTSPQLRLLHAPERTRQFASVAVDHERRRLAHRARIAELEAEGQATYQIKDDWSEDLRELDLERRRARDPFMRQAWTMAYLWAGSAHEFQHSWQLDEEIARDILNDVPPTSPLWSYTPHKINSVIRTASTERRPQRLVEGERMRTQPVHLNERYRDYVEALAAHPDSAASMYWLSAAVNWAQGVGDFEALSRYLGLYMERFGSTDWGERMAQRFRSERNIEPGRLVPPFSFPSLDDPDRLITREGLLGQPYIVNFWATWCGPCIRKIDTLARTDNVYGADGLRILSVSIDFQRQHALEFREQGHPMPWLNAYLDGWQVQEEGVLKDFEVVNIPYGMLVDEHGTIVALDEGTDDFLNAVVELMEAR